MTDPAEGVPPGSGSLRRSPRVIALRHGHQATYRQANTDVVLPELP